MAGHLATVDGPPSDAELISAVRSGDTDAYGELFARHVEAARRLGRQLVSAGDVDDLVSEAFAKVLQVLQRGGGPDLAFRAYLLTAVRRLHVDRIRMTARLHTTDDLTPFDPGVPFRDTAVEGFESAAAARAFASLPERWQLVLWHTEVERQKPAEVATLLGMTPNSVSALAYRAREGLRQAYLSMHTQDVEEDACARTRAALGGYVRGGLSRRDASRVEEHLRECRACAAIYLELTEVNSCLGALLAPALLGAAAAAYLGGVGAVGGGTAATGGLLALVDRAKDLVVANASTAAVSGAAAAAVVAAGMVLLTQRGPDLPTAQDAPPVTAPSTSTTSSATPGGPPRPSGPAPSAPAARTTARSAPGPGAASTAGPGSAPGTAPGGSGSTVPPPQPSAPPPSAPPPSSPPSTPPSTPPPSTPPSSGAPVVQVDVEVSAGPDGVGVGATVGALGTQLPPVQATVPVPVGGLGSGPPG